MRQAHMPILPNSLQSKMHFELLDLKMERKQDTFLVRLTTPGWTRATYAPGDFFKSPARVTPAIFTAALLSL